LILVTVSNVLLGILRREKNIRGVGGFQILVEAVALRDKLLLPLSESLFFDLDLLGETLAEVLFLLLELGVVQLAWSSFSKLPCLHLLSTVRLIVRLLGGVDEVKHVSADEDGSKLLEVAVVLILNLGNTPGVLTTLYNLAFVVLDVFLGANNGEWHGGRQATGVGSSVFVILLDWWLVDLDTLRRNNSTNLDNVSKNPNKQKSGITHSLLETSQIRGTESVGLGNDRNQVHTGAQTFHNFNVKGFQSVTGGTDKVETCMNTEIDLVRSAGLLLLQHI
jgi:hypothetical protein